MCHMGQQKFTLHCPFDLPVRYHRGELFENVHYIQVRLKASVAFRHAILMIKIFMLYRRIPSCFWFSYLLIIN